MTDRRLSAVSRTQGANRALKDGTITPARWDLAFVEVPVLVDAFRRMVRGLEFDMSEMAITTYLCAKAHGTPFTALPIFLVRAFHHGAIAVNTRAGIDHPKDLEGRRVGVSRGYTVTTGVWARGILQDEYGVDLDAVTWVLSGDEHVEAYRPPANVVPMESGATLADLLVSGELAAVIGVDVDHPDVTPLIPDADEAGFAALAQRGHYPINHLVVVKDDLLEAHPDIAVEVFEAFTAAKNDYVSQLRAGAGATPSDRMLRRVMDITGADPMPYGIEPNRHAIEELIRHAVSQHIIDESPAVEYLFAEGTRKVVG
jgi:4,5-dihydroxyphthalate decarboxylase